MPRPLRALSGVGHPLTNQVPSTPSSTISIACCARPASFTSRATAHTGSCADRIGGGAGVEAVPLLAATLLTPSAGRLCTHHSDAATAAPANAGTLVAWLHEGTSGSRSCSLWKTCTGLIPPPWSC